MTAFTHRIINESVDVCSRSKSVLSRSKKRKKRGRLLLTAGDIRKACREIAPAAMCYDSCPASLTVRFKRRVRSSSRRDRAYVPEGALREKDPKHFRSFKGVHVRPWEYKEDRSTGKVSAKPATQSSSSSATVKSPVEKTTAFLASIHDLEGDSSHPFSRECVLHIQRHAAGRFPESSASLLEGLEDDSVRDSPRSPVVRSSTAAFSRAMMMAPNSAPPLSAASLSSSSQQERSRYAFSPHRPTAHDARPPHSESRLPSAPASQRFFAGGDEEEGLAVGLADAELHLGASRIWGVHSAQPVRSAQPTPVKFSATSPVRSMDTVERVFQDQGFDPKFLDMGEEEEPSVGFRFLANS